MTKPAILPDTDAEPKTRRHRKPVEELTTVERVARAGVALETAKELLHGLDPAAFGGAVGNLSEQIETLMVQRDSFEGEQDALLRDVMIALKVDDEAEIQPALAKLLGID